MNPAILDHNVNLLRIDKAPHNSLSTLPKPTSLEQLSVSYSATTLLRIMVGHKLIEPI